MAAAPLYIVGIGPGDSGYLTCEAKNILERVVCLAGYGLYLDLLPDDIKNGKQLIESGMRHEKARCQASISNALAGYPTALVCSGDPGIYALAGLVIECCEEIGAIHVLPLAIIPGVPAMCAAASLLGAPLGHDFASISLSDLLTPWESIKKKIHYALAADFVCVLHNPRSHNRPFYLAQALDIAKSHRPPTCPVGLVKNAFRKGQQIHIATVATFDPEQADMLSIVIIGNTESRMAGNYMLTPRGYHKKPLG